MSMTDCGGHFMSRVQQNWGKWNILSCYHFYLTLYYNSVHSAIGNVRKVFWLNNQTEEHELTIADILSEMKRFMFVHVYINASMLYEFPKLIAKCKTKPWRIGHRYI